MEGESRRACQHLCGDYRGNFSVTIGTAYECLMAALLD